MSHDNDLELRGEWWWPKHDHGCWEWMHAHAGLAMKVAERAKRRRTAIVAGANCGWYVPTYAEKFQSVVAIEPDALNFAALVRNCQQSNVFKMQAALGCEAGTAGLTTTPGNCGGSFITEDGILPVLTVDSLELPVDVLHLDVEGYEMFAILGAMNTIQEYRPVILVENIAGNGDRYGVKAESIRDYLETLDYVQTADLGDDLIYEHR